MSGIADEPLPCRAVDEHNREVQLRTIAEFGPNPGNLTMHVHAPAGGQRQKPLVVVLHGCTQSAAGYASASGWSRLAEAHDFIVLFPEQRRENNQQSCFSWFECDGDARGTREVESIRQMVEHATDVLGANEKEVFVCGLSAGGAMTANLVAMNPDVFRGAAIIAGLPYGTAANLSDAYESMSRGRIRDARIWGDLVRGASPHAGPWPEISIWHGTADNVVKPINAGELVKQWTNVHGLGAIVPAEDHLGRVARRVWSAGGNRVVREYVVPGMGHGVPVDDRDPPAPFFLPAGLSSTQQIAADWGLTSQTKPRRLLAMLGM